MSRRTERDALARYLYIHAHDDGAAAESWRTAGAQEWDSGQASQADRDDCYRQADAIFSGGEVPTAARTRPDNWPAEETAWTASARTQPGTPPSGER